MNSVLSLAFLSFGIDIILFIAGAAVVRGSVLLLKAMQEFQRIGTQSRLAV